MFERQDEFEMNRSVTEKNPYFQELNVLLEDIRNFMHEISYL